MSTLFRKTTLSLPARASSLTRSTHLPAVSPISQSCISRLYSPHIAPSTPFQGIDFGSVLLSQYRDHILSVAPFLLSVSAKFTHQFSSTRGGYVNISHNVSFLSQSMLPTTVLDEEELDLHLPLADAEKEGLETVNKTLQGTLELEALWGLRAKPDAEQRDMIPLLWHHDGNYFTPEFSDFPRIQYLKPEAFGADGSIQNSKGTTRATLHAWDLRPTITRNGSLADIALRAQYVHKKRLMKMLDMDVSPPQQ